MRVRASAKRMCAACAAAAAPPLGLLLEGLQGFVHTGMRVHAVGQVRAFRSTRAASWCVRARAKVRRTWLGCWRVRPARPGGAALRGCSSGCSACPGVEPSKSADSRAGRESSQRCPGPELSGASRLAQAGVQQPRPVRRHRRRQRAVASSRALPPARRRRTSRLPTCGRGQRRACVRACATLRRT